MSDRELLELAAKAAGIYVGDGPSGMWLDPTFPCLVNGNGASWSPLTDDGDALRLAVKLNLSIVIDSEIGVVQVGRFDFKEDIREVEPAKNLPYAATRRAIVRAAAKIGRNMK